ncbi:MAG: helix-turn-helix transcriptional regulator [Armatimonadetes bacterium]|nr:helix-turn-helix transcriptional regulator [Armatimonadota bacterium]
MNPIRRRARNRIQQIMIHTSRYSFMGQARLAEDAGVSRSALSRILSGQSNPSFALVMALHTTLEKELGKRIDPREVLSLDGTYPTPSVCELVGCKGCLPANFYDRADNIKEEFREVPSGQWSIAPKEEV